jgi:cobalt-zinc-cadmium efflux system membrane fusion protein
MAIDSKSALIGAGVTALVALALHLFVREERHATAANADVPRAGATAKMPAPRDLELSEAEFANFKVLPAKEHEFKIQREAVGSIDFNQEMSVNVFTPFPGRIISPAAKAGESVRKGELLFTVDSADLLQAESGLVAAAGSLELTRHSLERARQLVEVQGVSQKELDQATSDNQAAEGAFKAARDALRIYGKSDAEVDRIVADRRIDSVLNVYSPIAGQVTARNAAPGLFVQPGVAPAPYTVADTATVWMLASVGESDYPLLALGQEVDVSVKAYPSRVYRGRIVNIGSTVDLVTRRVIVRSEVPDPRHELRPGMFATFLIRTGRATRSIAVPEAGVVREGDGTMTVWVNPEGRKLVKRTVVVGLLQEGMHQILDGLVAGERVATDGALFLNNALTAASR